MLNIQIDYANHSVDFAKVPAPSIEALLRRGVAHFLGNEQASKVTAWKAKLAGDKENPREPSEDEVEQYKNDLVSTALADIYAGDIGSGRGPRLDPVERELRSLVDSHIANTLAGNGIKFPKGRKLPADGEVVKFANGATRTMDQMRENVLKTHGDKFRKDAEKRVADLAKKAAQAKANAEALAQQGPVDAEALGL